MPRHATAVATLRRIRQWLVEEDPRERGQGSLTARERSGEDKVASSRGEVRSTWWPSRGQHRVALTLEVSG